MTHPNADFISHFYDLYSRGEMHALAQLFASDFLFVPAGKHSVLAGPRQGVAEMQQFTELQSELTDGTWIPRPYDIVAGDQHTVVLVTVTATRRGRTHEFHLVHVWRIRDCQVTELRSYVDDQYTYDAFFGD